MISGTIITATEKSSFSKALLTGPGFVFGIRGWIVAQVHM
jgi:hypothetical protein